LDYYRIPFTNDVTFFGGISIKDTLGEIDYVSVHRPDIYCGYIFKGILNQKNIKFGGKVLSIEKTPDNTEEIYQSSLFEWQSDSLGVIISVINKRSQNFFAEQTVLTIGKELGGEGSFDCGLNIIRDYLESIGFTEDDLAMYDGSGLSYMNLVKPDAIVRLLKYMRNHHDWDTYYNSMRTPVNGRLDNVEFRNNVRVKGGTIANTRTYSGYIEGPESGDLLAISIMVNNYSCPKKYVEAWQDSIIIAVLEGY
jgi:D-alanyl-D-alanine carboxypeptidase/D-alanyl-D-alanine-endopeptidase (penicillin-binding protein 4)